MCPTPAVGSPAGTPPGPLRWVLSRAPTGTFTPQAWLSTHPQHPPEHLRTWLVRRWTREVTCEAAPAPRGRDTPRQWHDQAMGRTTPVWLRLESIITVTAHRLIHPGANGVRRTAWHPTTRPTCSAAIAWVRRPVWDQSDVSPSHQDTDMLNISRALLERFTEALGYAA